MWEKKRVFLLLFSSFCLDMIRAQKRLSSSPFFPPPLVLCR